MVDEIIQTDAVSIGVPTMKENHDSRTYAIQQISSPQRKTSKYRPHSPDEVKDEWRDKKTSEEGAFIWFPLDNNAAQDESPSSPPRVPRPFKSSHDEQRSPSRKSREDERSPSRSLSPQKNAPAHKRDIVKSAHQKPSEPPSLNLPILHEQQVNEPLEPGLVDICEAFLKSGFLGCLDLSVLDDE